MLSPGGYSLEDLALRRRILNEIAARYRIEVFVETGVNEGKSTVEFAKMSHSVVAIDNDPECLDSAHRLLTAADLRPRATLLQGSSPEVLRNIAPLLPDATLYFLDAHWDDYWPVLDEVAAIRPGSGVIVVHDIRVPGHPGLGWDTYHGQPLCYEYLKERLTAWSPTHVVHYNDRTEDTNQPRGAAFIFPR